MLKNTKYYLILTSIILIIFLYIDGLSFLDKYFEEKPLVSIYPENIYKGDPVFVEINASSTIDKAFYNNKELTPYKNGKSILYIFPTDFYEKKDKHIFKIRLSNGINEEREIVLKDREKIERKLDIPQKLGGNTKVAAQKVVNNLVNENYILNNIKSDNKQYWKDRFSKPLKILNITDTFGYNRNTVGNIIVHKGLDFRATESTSIYAMNEGVVKVARKFETYGNTVVLDHGFGLLTLYMHLSKINVKEGDIVKDDQEIGLSGDTGYTTAPHLHISIKIDGVSINPEVFMKYFKLIP